MQSSQLRRRLIGASLGVMVAAGVVLTTYRADEPEPIPSGFRTSWDPAFRVYRRGPRDFTTSLTPESMIVTTSATRYVATTGNDANTGLAQLSPKRSYWSASLAAGATATTIYVAAGTYDASYGWVGVTPTGDQNVIATGGRVRFTTAAMNLVWTLGASGDGPNVYSVSLAPAPYNLGAPYAVVDELQLDAGGHGTWLTSQASVALVQANPGSYYYDAGADIIYVRLAGGRAPDTQVQVCPGGKVNGILNGAARRLYVQGVDFICGHGRAFFSQTADRVVFDDVTFRYANIEGLGVYLTNESYCFDCRADDNNADGFSYDSTSRSLKVLEVNSSSHGNGKGAAAGISNGSTTHAGTSIIRIGGRHETTDGPIVADVQNGKTLNFGVTVADSDAVTVGQRVGFWTGGTMWLRECRVESAGLTLDVRADEAGDAMYLNGTSPQTSGGLGSVGGWAP